MFFAPSRNWNTSSDQNPKAEDKYCKIRSDWDTASDQNPEAVGKYHKIFLENVTILLSFFTDFDFESVFITHIAS